jgi:hypothetical protein
VLSKYEGSAKEIVTRSAAKGRMFKDNAEEMVGNTSEKHAEGYEMVSRCHEI